ncbi:hypothetical protein AB0J71_09010 [Nonomuraea sp. NPDC049637]|uniref:hypothetical protein n=1 Tax=Nonomuraea sp. NPDC049637 TaxID=3154356 RepID=UPI003423C6F0
MSPTLEHEFLLELVRQRPSLVATLLTEAGVPVPRFDEARLESPDFTACQPTEFRADAVVVLTDGKPLAGVVVEVQRRYREEKTWSWPVYLATLRARIKGPCLLLVFCPDRKEARKCARAIDMGHPGWTLHPIVIGPDQIPKVTDLLQAIAEPELATLSAIVHGNEGEEGLKILQTFVDSLEHLPREHEIYVDLVLTMLPDVAVKKFLEFTMAMGTREPKSKWVRHWVAESKAEGISEGEARGEARGEAKAVLRILEARGITVPEEAAERIGQCTDLDLLESWIDRALTVEAVEELFNLS